MSQRSDIQVGIAATIPGAHEIMEAIAAVSSDGHGQKGEGASMFETAELLASNAELAGHNQAQVVQLHETLGQQQAEIIASPDASGVGLPHIPGMDVHFMPHADSAFAATGHDGAYGFGDE